MEISRQECTGVRYEQVRIIVEGLHGRNKKKMPIEYIMGPGLLWIKNKLGKENLIFASF